MGNVGELERAQKEWSEMLQLLEKAKDAELAAAVKAVKNKYAKVRECLRAARAQAGEREAPPVLSRVERDLFTEEELEVQRVELEVQAKYADTAIVLSECGSCPEIQKAAGEGEVAEPPRAVEDDDEDDDDEDDDEIVVPPELRAQMAGRSEDNPKAGRKTNGAISAEKMLDVFSVFRERGENGICFKELCERCGLKTAAERRAIDAWLSAMYDEEALISVGKLRSRRIKILDKAAFERRWPS